MPTLDAGWTRRNAPLLIAGLLGIVLGVVIMILLSGGTGDNSAAPAAAASPTASASPTTSKTATPKPVRPTASKAAPSPTRTATPTPTPKPTPTGPVSFTYKSCGPNHEDYSTMQEVWEGSMASMGTHVNNGCQRAQRSPGTLDELQLTALETAYGSADPTKLSSLYLVCTKRGAPVGETAQYVPIDAVHTEAQAKELAGAFLLCPDHPEADRITSSMAVFNGSQVDEGSYLVGVDIQPGTWLSVGEKVTDCYWEISDAQGNIIDNQFISIAPQITVVIPPEAAGFTATGCSFRLQE